MDLVWWLGGSWLGWKLYVTYIDPWLATFAGFRFIRREDDVEE